MMSALPAYSIAGCPVRVSRGLGLSGVGLQLDSMEITSWDWG